MLVTGTISIAPKQGWGSHGIQPMNSLELLRTLRLTLLSIICFPLSVFKVTPPFSSTHLQPFTYMYKCSYAIGCTIFPVTAVPTRALIFTLSCAIAGLPNTITFGAFSRFVYGASTTLLQRVDFPVRLQLLRYSWIQKGVCLFLTNFGPYTFSTCLNSALHALQFHSDADCFGFDPQSLTAAYTCTCI